MHILQKIVEAKKKEILSLPEIDVANLPPRKDFVGALLQAVRPSIIAEIKPKSPSQGFLFERSKVPSIVTAYNTNADAISVLCDKEFFGGGYDLLREVRALTGKPILAKEFIIDAKQIRYAAESGADAILLIASILTDEELSELATDAALLGLGVLLEVHSEKEVQRVAQTYQSMPSSSQAQIVIGINNRDLDTLEIDLRVTERLAPKIRELMPSIRCVITESGVKSSDDVLRLQKHVQGFLIGTSILRSENPADFLSSLFPSEIKVKFCGMTNADDIVAAEDMRVDFLGFIFVPSSPRHVSLEQAIQLKKDVRHAKTVGVFTDMPLEQIEKHIKALKLDYVQLHAKPDIQLCKDLSVPVIQAFRGVPSVDILEEFLDVCPYVLIDKEDGKDQIDFHAISSLPKHIQSRVFLAGGLNPSNISQATQMTHPYAVDCARGIESAPGKKDKSLMASFLTSLAA